MRLAEAARPLLSLGRGIALATAVFASGLMMWQAYDLLSYAFTSENPTWGEVGVLPFVTGLRIAVAAWIAWGAFALDGHSLLRALLAAFGVSFVLLYGWHFLLVGMDAWFFYLVAAGDFLYLAGALVVGLALRSQRTGFPLGTDQARSTRGS